MKYFFFAVSFIFSSLLLFGQTSSYDILLVGSDVGDMTITRSINGTKKYYSLQSNTSVIFGTRVDKYTCTMEFENNVLVKSTMENRKNGKVIWFTYVNKVGDAGYKVQTEKGLSTIAGNVSYCCYDIFFKEPKNGESVFSERFGKFGNLAKKEDHIYELEIKGEETYTYYFENGSMTKMETPSFLGKVKMVKK
jgi:hypothetical protein